MQTEDMLLVMSDFLTSVKKLKENGLTSERMEEQARKGEKKEPSIK